MKHKQINPKDIKLDLVDVESNYGEMRWTEAVGIMLLFIIIGLLVVALLVGID